MNFRSGLYNWMLDIIMIMEGSVNMMNGSAEKMSVMNGKCGDVIMRVYGNGTIVRKEKGIVTTLRCAKLPLF
jgi:hypothetical protein